MGERLRDQGVAHPEVHVASPIVSATLPTPLTPFLVVREVVHSTGLGKKDYDRRLHQALCFLFSICIFS